FTHSSCPSPPRSDPVATVVTVWYRPLAHDSPTPYRNRSVLTNSVTNRAPVPSFTDRSMAPSVRATVRACRRTQLAPRTPGRSPTRHQRHHILGPAAHHDPVAR